MLKQFFDLRSNRFRIGVWGESVHDSALPIHEKLGEVPRDASDPEKPALALFEETVERVRCGSIHIDFGKDGEADAVILLAEGADLFPVSRFLVTKLIAGKAKHGESAVLIGLIEPLEA